MRELDELETEMINGGNALLRAAGAWIARKWAAHGTKVEAAAAGAALGAAGTEAVKKSTSPGG